MAYLDGERERGRRLGLQEEGLSPIEVPLRQLDRPWPLMLILNMEWEK